MEQEINKINIKEKKKRGRKLTQTGPVQDKEYFKKYYHAHLAQLARCDICNSCISIQKMKRHKASKRCEKLTLIPLKVV